MMTTPKRSELRKNKFCPHSHASIMRLSRDKVRAMVNIMHERPTVIPCKEKVVESHNPMKAAPESMSAKRGILINKPFIILKLKPKIIGTRGFSGIKCIKRARVFNKMLPDKLIISIYMNKSLLVSFRLLLKRRDRR